MSPENAAPEMSTLAQRLAEGRIALPEALRYGMLIAEALRKMHDAGRVHGALSPGCIMVYGGGLEVFSETAQDRAVTPYTAPEALDGRPADARSDVFSFGAILYEMLTGQRAFAGEGAELANALASAVPPPSGSPLVDRVLANCLAKDPAARWPRMQKIVLELKLLTAAARRAGAQAPVQRQDAQIAEIRSEMREFEERVGARLQSHEKNMADLQRAATVAVEALRGQLATLDTQLSAAMDRCAQPDPKLEDLEERVTSRFVRGLEAAGERIARVEQNVDAAREHSAGFERDVTAHLADLEAALRTQELALQAARTALAQTDDVLERVVEALDSLQSAVLEHTDQRSTGAAAN